jgi:mannitol-1-phosphate/altronate dehydrogenase
LFEPKFKCIAEAVVWLSLKGFEFCTRFARTANRKIPSEAGRSLPRMSARLYHTTAVNLIAGFGTWLRFQGGTNDEKIWYVFDDSAYGFTFVISQWKQG